MNDYIKTIIRNKTDLIEIEKQVLIHKGNLPVLSKAHAFLPPLHEVIVKALYLSGGLFLSDIKKLMCFQSDTQKVERALKALLQDGYLIYQNTTLGNLYGLTGKGISQIRYHHDYYEGEPPTLSDMKLDIEGSLTKRRIISAFIADYVFQIQNKELYLQFFTTPKIPRNEYLLQQFLMQISFRNFLKQDVIQKLKILDELSLTQDQKNSLLSASSYNQKTAEIYSNACIKKWGLDELKSKEIYHHYISLIREECLKNPTTNTFYLLKSFTEAKTSEYNPLKILLLWDCNLLKHGMDSIWKSLEDELTKNTLLYKEKALEAHNQCIKYLGDERRSLIQRNAYKKQTDEELLKQITTKLSQLDACLEKFREVKGDLETDFCFPVLSGYDEDGSNYEERVITFKRLEQNAIHIEVTPSKKIIFYVVQVQDDYFDLFSLHKKLAMLFQLYRRIFKLNNLEIKILTLTEEQKRFVESKQNSLQKKLLASKETAFLGNSLKDTFSVSAVSTDITERYHFFHHLYNELYGGEKN